MDAQGRKDVAVVIGAAELGSAVAVRLCQAGYAVVLCDDVDPPGIRRGASFLDAWYIGTASLDHVRATFCGSRRSIPFVLGARRTIAATTWSWRGVAGELDPCVIVDAHQDGRAAPQLIAGVPAGVVTVGAAAGHRAGRTAHIVVPAELRTSARVPDRWTIDAPIAGRFQTAREIGEPVQAGDPIGGIGPRAIAAPARGVLSGLAARGSHVMAGAPVAEIDPRGDAVRCFLVDEACDAVARAIVVELRRRRTCDWATPKEAAAETSGGIGLPRASGSGSSVARSVEVARPPVRS